MNYCGVAALTVQGFCAHALGVFVCSPFDAFLIEGVGHLDTGHTNPFALATA